MSSRAVYVQYVFPCAYLEDGIMCLHCGLKDDVVHHRYLTRRNGIELGCFNVLQVEE